MLELAQVDFLKCWLRRHCLVSFIHLEFKILCFYLFNIFSDVSQLSVPKFGQPIKNNLALKKSVHEQDEGTIFAICATGTSTKDSLLSWIRCLEADGNDVLGNIPVLFKFRSLTTSKEVSTQVNDNLYIT